MSALIVGGQSIPVPFKVVTWLDAGGVSFYNKPKSWKKRTTKPDLMVLHWTVSPSLKSAYNGMIGRELSVHLFMDVDGTVYQTLDLRDVTAYHAAGVNTRSVGIEIVNPVTPAFQDPKNPWPEVKSDGLHGKAPMEHLDFRAEQKNAIVGVCEAVCNSLGIPLKIPKTGLGIPRTKLSNLSSFKGVIGHYHVTTNKLDPGTTLWPVFTSRGW